MATAAAIARLTTQRQTFQRRVLSSFEVAGLTGVDGTLHDFGTLGEDEASSSDLVLPMGVAVAVSLDDDWDVGDIAIQDNAGQEVFAKAGVADQIVRVNGFFPGGRIVNVYRGTGSPEGTLTLYLINHDRYVAVGEAVFGAGGGGGGGLTQPPGDQPAGTQPPGDQPGE